jgi:hypothetical protein
MTTGEVLKKDLGLSKFKYVLIQKIIELPTNIYIITVDSRFPTVYIPFARIKKLRSTVLSRLKVTQLMGTKSIKKRPLRSSLPIPLTRFDRAINSNDVIFLRDIAGEYRMDKRFYENIRRIK